MRLRKKSKAFILGNNYFYQLEDIFDVRQASQAVIVEKIGLFSDIRCYFECIDFQPDLLFLVDESLPPLCCGLERLNIPLVGYLIDSHLHYDWHRYFSQVFDHCFIAQKNYFQAIQHENKNCSWLPLFAPNDLCLNRERDIDICFVGTLDVGRNPERVKFIQTFNQHLPLTVRHGAYQELYSRSRIILNQSVRDDINFRVYESMACGGLLLTDDVENGLEEMFNNGIHLILYEKGNVFDAMEKANYYLTHEEERKNIAMAGHLETVRRHTAQTRMISINIVFQRLLGNKAVDNCAARRNALKKTYSALARKYSGSFGDKALAESYNFFAGAFSGPAAPALSC